MHVRTLGDLAGGARGSPCDPSTHASSLAIDRTPLSPLTRAFSLATLQVWANITATQQLLGWAGPGSERIHLTYPVGQNGNQTFE